MGDIRSEVMKALPFLSETDLNLLMMRLDQLGVEAPQDMKLVEERDLACVLKVIQCRKLINHFKAFGHDHSWISSSPVQSKTIQEQQSYYQTNSTNSSMPAGFISPYNSLKREVGRDQNSFAHTVGHSDCLQAETMNTLSSSKNPALSPISVAPFTVSHAYTISDVSSTTTTTCACPNLNQQESQMLFSEEDNKVLQTFDNSSSASNSYVTFTGESEVQNVIPTLHSTSDFENVSAVQDSGNIEPQASSVACASLYGPQSRNSKIPRSDKTSDNIDNSGMSGNTVSNYELPVHKLTVEIQTALKNKKQLNKSASHDLVRAIVADLLEQYETLSTNIFTKVTRAVVNEYPESLNEITSGKSNKPGYESLLNMIINRSNNLRYPSNEKSYIESTAPLKSKRSNGRSKANKRSRSLEKDEADESFIPHIDRFHPGSVFGMYQVPLRNLPHDIIYCLKHSKPLNEFSKNILVEKIADDLSDRNCRPTQEDWEVIAKTVLDSYPGSLTSGRESTKSEHYDFLQRLNREIEVRSSNVKRKLANEDIHSRSLVNTACTVKLHPVSLSGKMVTSGTSDSAFDSKPSSISFDHWNILRNYKVPFDNLPSVIQNDLTGGVPIENETRDELIEIIIHDILQIIPKPTREELKVSAKAVVKAYPDSLQSFVKYNRFNYLAFLKKFMDMAAKITGDKRLAFSHARKNKRQDTVNDEDNFYSPSSGISKNEMTYFTSLKEGLRTQSRHIEWNNEINNAMSTTYNLQRIEINKGFVMRTLKEEWPFLFHEKGFLLHTRLLLGSCLKKRMEQNLRDKLNVLFNYLVNQKLKPEDIIKEMSGCNNSDDNIRTVILLIVEFFEENSTDLLHKLENQTDAEPELPCDPCITTSGNFFSVWVQKTVLVQEVSFSTALIIYFGTYLVFGLSYPASLNHTLVFVQRCFAEIGFLPECPISQEVSEKVEGLLKNSFV